jgi:hypothetical protein
MSNLDPILPGEMQFLDSEIPHLAAGTYKIEVKHNIQEPSYDIKGNYDKDQQFIVQAPHFSLPPNSVQGQYPTSDSQTNFETTLPYLILGEGHLPWCRKIGGTAGDAPWLALMIFKADEIVYDPLNGEISPTKSTVRIVKTEVAGLDDKVNKTKGPEITLDAIEGKLVPPLRATTIDVLASTFRQLAPKASELPFLAHIRKINSGGLAADGHTGERTYANLLANRFAEPGSNALYIAHLVSLEGWGKYLPGAIPAVTFDAGQKFRLVSLYSWKFNNKSVNFRKTLAAMDANTLQLPFIPPKAWGKDDTKYTDAQKKVQEKYANGYMALNYNTRTGEDAFAWYRGPFTPVVPVIVKNIQPEISRAGYLTKITSADEAIIYDEQTGLFDQSYAVAWELGRMLTLANRPAAIAIWQWKKLGLRKLQVLGRIIADKQKKQRKLLGASATLELNAFLDNLNWQQVRDDLMDDQAGKYIFMNYLGRSLGKRILDDTNKDEAPINVLDPTGLQQHLNEMPGILGKDELLIALQNGIDPHILISDKMEAAYQTYGLTEEQ